MEPVFITKNGKGDLAVMSMELYDKLCAGMSDDGDISGLIMSLGDNDPELGRQRLYALLEEGFEDIKQGRTNVFRDVINEMREEL